MNAVHEQWLTPPSDLPAFPDRIILHWTAGSYVSTEEERLRYHVLIEQRGDEAMPVKGWPLERNMRSLSAIGRLTSHKHPAHPKAYAAHTGGLNSYSMGVSLCGMRDANSRALIDRTAFPITVQQVKLLIGVVAIACAVYRLEVSKDTVFTHYEAFSLHGKQQHADKWDIGWIPQHTHLALGEVGDWLREQITRRLRVERSNLATDGNGGGARIQLDESEEAE